MIKVQDIKVYPGQGEKTLKRLIYSRLSLNVDDVTEFRILHKAVDARDKNEIRLIYTVAFEVKPELERELLSLGHRKEDTGRKERSGRKDKTGPAEKKEETGHEGKKTGFGDAVKRQNADAGTTLKKELFVYYRGLKMTRMKKEDAVYEPVLPGTESLAGRPVVVGFGPAGMFAALTLAEAGYRPLVLERGTRMEERVRDVEGFWAGGPLKPESNVQFGEGGAGTFSDGKLTTGTHDPRIARVLDELAKASERDELRYEKKPHIGTDELRKVVVTIRKRIEELGGEIRFNQKVTGWETEDVLPGGNSKKATAEEKRTNERGEDSRIPGFSLPPDENANGVKEEHAGEPENRIKTLFAVNTKTGEETQIETGAVVFALGHSARDTWRSFYEKGLSMEPKAFSIGVRAEHLQSMIDISQYGQSTKELKLEPADYKLAVRVKDGTNRDETGYGSGKDRTTGMQEKAEMNSSAVSGEDSAFSPKSSSPASGERRTICSEKPSGLPGIPDEEKRSSVPNVRGVYTFCMCPGGTVVAAASDEGMVVTNGMSNRDRGGRNANSAVLVDVRPEDYLLRDGNGELYAPEDAEYDPLAGVAFQEKYERLAFLCGGRDYTAPAEKLGDFLAGKTAEEISREAACVFGRGMEAPGSADETASSDEAGTCRTSPEPTYARGVKWTDISACLPDFATTCLREAFPLFGRKIKGFDSPDTILTAVETRSSSPVRIPRNEDGLAYRKTARIKAGSEPAGGDSTEKSGEKSRAYGANLLRECAGPFEQTDGKVRTDAGNDSTEQPSEKRGGSEPGDSFDNNNSNNNNKKNNNNNNNMHPVPGGAEKTFVGFYPAGEGAGYAGGIVSAAVDGIRQAEAIIRKYKPVLSYGKNETPTNRIY